MVRHSPIQAVPISRLRGQRHAISYDGNTTSMNANSARLRRSPHLYPPHPERRLCSPALLHPISSTRSYSNTLRALGSVGTRTNHILETSCEFRSRPAAQLRFRRRIGARWERASIVAQPCSAYLLRGPSRSEWEHSISAVERRRYSITFRPLATDGATSARS